MREQLERDFERFGRELPRDFPDYVRERYRIDLSARYLGFSVPHPVGKGSGQLSLNQDQLEADRDAGLAFVVLKTVIAEDAAGERSMGAWAIHETRMKVERRRSAAGEEGWTVTWKGRGWDRSFDDYLALVRAAADVTRSGAMVAVPSVKYHLPPLGEPFREGEYRHTTKALVTRGARVAAPGEGFLADTRRRPAGRRTDADSPLAPRGSGQDSGRRPGCPARAQADERPASTTNSSSGCWTPPVGRRARRVQPTLVPGPGGGLRRVRPERPKPPGARSRAQPNRGIHRSLVPATSPRGRLLLDYARSGCESVQLTPCSSFPWWSTRPLSGSRQQRALHLLYFHPIHGVIAGMLDLEAAGEIARVGGQLRFLDVCGSRVVDEPMRWVMAPSLRSG